MLHTNVILCNFELAFRDIIRVKLPTVLVSTVVITIAVFVNLLIKHLLGVSGSLTLLASANDTVYKTTTMLKTRPIIGDRPRGATITISAIIVFNALSVFVCPTVCHTNVLSLASRRVKLCAKSALRRITRIMNTNGIVKGRVSSATVVIGVVHIVVLTPILIVVDFTLTHATIGTMSSDMGRATTIATGQNGVAVP